MLQAAYVLNIIAADFKFHILFTLVIAIFRYIIVDVSNPD